MNVLITGGGGYLGTRTAIEMANVGHEVTIFDVRSKPAGWDLYAPPNITFVQGDLLKLDEICEISEGKQVFVHMAFVVGGPSCTRNPSYATSLALTGTNNLIAVTGERRIIFTSTDAVYGNKAPGLVREDFPCEPCEIYGRLKLEVEKMVKKCPRFDIIRMPTSFGVSPVMRHDLLVHHIVRQLFRNGRVLLSRPEITRSIVEVSDAANAIVSLLEQEPTNQVINVLTEGLTKLEIAHRAAELVGGTVEIDDRLPGDPDARNFVLDTTRARSLGWQPRHSLSSGIRDLLNYLNVMSFRPGRESIIKIS